MFSSPRWKHQRALESVTLRRLHAEQQTLRQVASYMKSELNRVGLESDVLVDQSIADKSVDMFLVGDANAVFWAHGVADVFECAFSILDDGAIVFRPDMRAKP